MKYQMQNRNGQYLLIRDAEEIIPTGPSWNVEWALAAVEFWQEIERLRAQLNEAHAALSEIWFDETGDLTCPHNIANRCGQCKRKHEIARQLLIGHDVKTEWEKAAIARAEATNPKEPI